MLSRSVVVQAVEAHVLQRPPARRGAESIGEKLLPRDIAPDAALRILRRDAGAIGQAVLKLVLARPSARPPTRCPS